MKNLIRRMLANLVTRLPKGVLTDRAFFDLYQKAGFHVTPVHFYQPIPDTTALPEALWTRRSELVGIDLHVDRQLGVFEDPDLPTIVDGYYALIERYAREHSDVPQTFGTPVDGIMLSYLIHKHRPRRIVEIGSGFSTVIASETCRALGPDMAQSRIEAYEPYPRPHLLTDAFPNVTVAKTFAQDIPFETVTSLQPNDILFIDSSHVLATGSDVQYEILELLPRVPKGVIVHVHDIFLPFDYPRDWVVERKTFWTEQYALQAFLTCNTDFQIIWSAGLMKTDHADRLSKHFRYNDPDGRTPGGSLWMQRVSETA